MLTGGATAGHLSPLKAIIEYFQSDSSKSPKITAANFLYIGHRQGIERRTMPATGIHCSFIWAGKIRRYWSWRYLLVPMEMLIGYCQSLWILFFSKPKMVFSTGGFVSIPVVLAAYTLRIPIIIHEQTFIMGLANRLASFFAKEILLSFPQTTHAPKRAKVVGNPIRPSLYQGQANRAYNDFQLNPHRPLLLFMGGSQGAHFINMWVNDHLSILTQKWQIIVITGDNQDYQTLQNTRDILEKPSLVVVKKYIDNNLADIYKITKLVVSRAGAGTVNELYQLNIPAILIPLPLSGGGEQEKNAQWLEDSNTSQMIKQQDIQNDPSILLKTIQSYFDKIKPEYIIPKDKALDKIIKYLKAADYAML